MKWFSQKKILFNKWTGLSFFSSIYHDATMASKYTKFKCQNILQSSIDTQVLNENTILKIVEIYLQWLSKFAENFFIAWCHSTVFWNTILNFFYGLLSFIQINNFRKYAISITLKIWMNGIIQMINHCRIIMNHKFQNRS